MDRDYRRVAELHVESGWVPKDTRVDEFEFAIRTVCEPMFDRPIKQVSFGGFLMRLFQTARRFHMEILPQLLLLQKTLVNIEGVARQLYPDLDIWMAARPALERWMRDRVSARNILRSAKQRMPIDRLPEIPGLVIDLLDRAREGELQVQSSSQDFTEVRDENSDRPQAHCIGRYWNWLFNRCLGATRARRVRQHVRRRSAGSLVVRIGRIRLSSQCTAEFRLDR